METFSTLWKEKKKEKKKKAFTLRGLVIVKRLCNDIILLGWGGCVPFQVIKTPLPLGAQSSEIPFKAYIAKQDLDGKQGHGEMGSSSSSAAEGTSEAHKKIAFQNKL